MVRVTRAKEVVAADEAEDYELVDMRRDIVQHPALGSDKISGVLVDNGREGGQRQCAEAHKPVCTLYISERESSRAWIGSRHSEES